MIASLLLVLAPCVQAPASTSPEPADLVLTNGRVVTMARLDAEPVEALAARDGRVVAVGSSADLAALVGEGTEVIDLEGRLAVPGFVEGHAHYLGIGDAKMQLDLMKVSSWDEVVAMVADAVERAGPGELIRGRGWHQDKWTRVPAGAVEGLPTHRSLSAVSPDHPVILRHASGHATFANAKAMELAGISAATPDPEGGTIVRDADGAPIGAFRETASGLLIRAASQARPPEPRRLAELARDECLRKGVTSFQDAGSSFADVELFKALADEGELGVRLWVMIRESNARMEPRLADARVIGYGDHHLTVRGIKFSLDGALGSHGAWLLEPYADLPESSGLETTPLETIERAAQLALKHDYQLCVHAIGDRANRETLDLFERVLNTLPGDIDLRWRVEHAQHLHPDDVPRFAQLGAIASMQGVHCTSDGPWVPSRIGADRAREGAYVWRDLWDSGAVVTNGTDAPVEDVGPIPSFYATVTRRTASGEAFFPEQALTRAEALASYTRNGAYAAFEEDLKGTLEPGKLCDVVVLSKDILTCPEEEILDAKVLLTIVGGEVVHDAR